MANYHCKIKNISRGGDGGGRSSVASAAYRSGTNMTDERTGKSYNYANRNDILHEGIYVDPSRQAPDWIKNRSKAWNNIEGTERYKNARTAKEIQLALPYELDNAGMIDTVERYVMNNIVSLGVMADVAIHRYSRIQKPETQKGAEEIATWDKNIPYLEREDSEECTSRHIQIVRNSQGSVRGYKLYQPHVHIMMTTRNVNENGFEKTKNKELNRKALIYRWRESWQDAVNHTFEQLGLDIRISCKSVEAANDNNSTAANDNDMDKNTVDVFEYEYEYETIVNKQVLEENQPLEDDEINNNATNSQTEPPQDDIEPEPKLNIGTVYAFNGTAKAVLGTTSAYAVANYTQSHKEHENSISNALNKQLDSYDLMQENSPKLLGTSKKNLAVKLSELWHNFKDKIIDTASKISGHFTKNHLTEKDNTKGFEREL